MPHFPSVEKFLWTLRHLSSISITSATLCKHQLRGNGLTVSQTWVTVCCMGHVKHSILLSFYQSLNNSALHA